MWWRHTFVLFVATVNDWGWMRYRTFNIISKTELYLIVFKMTVLKHLNGGRFSQSHFFSQFFGFLRLRRLSDFSLDEKSSGSSDISHPFLVWSFVYLYLSLTKWPPTCKNALCRLNSIGCYFHSSFVIKNCIQE